MFRNFIIHKIFSEFLQPVRIEEYNGSPRSLNNGSLRSFYGSFLLGFRILLAWSISGRPDRSPTVVDTVTGQMSLSARSSRSLVLVSLSEGDEDELEEDVEQ